MGPAVMNLQVNVLYTRHWSCKRLPLIMKEPTADILPLENTNYPLLRKISNNPTSKLMSDAMLKGCGALHAHHILPLRKVWTTGASKHRYGVFYSPKNSLLATTVPTGTVTANNYGVEEFNLYAVLNTCCI